MKKQKLKTLAVLSIASLLGLTTVACGSKGNSEQSNNNSYVSEDSGSTDSGSVAQEKLILSSVSKKASFAAFDSNKGVKENKDEEFIDKTQEYTVGDDNPFNVKPVLTVVNQDLDLVDSSKWDYDFKFKVQVKDGDTLTDADSSLYEIVDAKNCDIQFKEAAVGKTFVVTVIAGGLTAEQEANSKYSQTITVKVTDGYNVYKAIELGYYDEREGDDIEEENHGGDNADFKNIWDAFKTEKGLRTGYYPSSLILQDNITITTEDVPSKFFYSAEDLVGQPDAERSVGSMRDDVYLYTRLTDSEVTINGNYFKLDYSRIPLVTREWGSTSAVGAVVSHTSLFRMRDGTTKFQNLNVTGNAKKATSDDDTIYGGGMMLAKAGVRANAVYAENVITRKCFITFMSEAVNDGEETVHFGIKNSIGTDNYNSFFYNWGGEVLVENSRYGGCGGPILIQDHTGLGSDGKCEENNGFTVLGKPSTTSFKNCTLQNYVAGSEAWFIQFNATSLVPGIKSLSDLYSQFGRSYVVDQNNNAAAMATGVNPSFFNFIALNKHSGSQGATDRPTCGTVNIINDEKVQVYNYLQPDAANYAKATEIQTALQGAQAGTVSAQELMALAAKYNVQYTDQDTLVSGLVAAATEAGNLATAQATSHGILRALQANGAPVFQSGDGFAYYDGNHQYLQPMSNAASGSTDPLTDSDPFVTGLSDTTALYFNSMMLVFGLSTYNA